MPNDHTTVSDLNRSDLARLTGCNLEKIRCYERVGMMPDPTRSHSCAVVEHIGRHHLRVVRAASWLTGKGRCLLVLGIIRRRAVRVAGGGCLRRGYFGESGRQGA